jgi:hypothetical protein
MLKVPRSCSRSRRVSIPADRRSFKTWKRCPRSGWNGWRISAHPKYDLCSSAVRADRRDTKLSYSSVRLGDFHPPHRLRFIGPVQQLFPNGWPMLFQVLWQLLDGHPVHASTPLVGLDSSQCLLAVFPLADFLHQLFRRWPGFRSRAFPQTIRSLPRRPSELHSYSPP